MRVSDNNQARYVLSSSGHTSRATENVWNGYVRVISMHSDFLANEK